MQRVEGEVELLECSDCAASFPTFVFSGDTDMVTFGLEAATSLEPPFIVLGRLNEEELSAEPSDGRVRFASRLGQLLGEHLVTISVAGWVHRPSAEGMTLQQFRQVYRPSEPIYHCPKCGGEAAVAERQTPADFVAQGGRLELAEDMALA